MVCILEYYKYYGCRIPCISRMGQSLWVILYSRILQILRMSNTMHITHGSIYVRKQVGQSLIVNPFDTYIERYYNWIILFFLDPFFQHTVFLAESTDWQKNQWKESETDWPQFRISSFKFKLDKGLRFFLNQLRPGSKIA